MCLMALSVDAQSYVDLGLPSGTKWKTVNETNPNDTNNFYTYDEAVAAFGGKLPTKEQFQELKDKCQWTWTDSGYRVTGPNGNSIVLPAAGFRICDGLVYGVGSCGDYWSSTPYGSEYALYLIFRSGGVDTNINFRFDGRSVRLVK